MVSANVRIVKWVLLFVGLFLNLMYGQDREKSFRIVRVETAPRIDGRVDDPCWQKIQPVSGFVQYDPVNGAAAGEQTLVWMAHDSKNLYFAFLMKDSQPKKIWAELTPRNNYENNDSITVILDTYNDKRTSFSFTVNPKNVQKNSVETIWRSGAKVGEDGWTAELAIPFKSLRFSTVSDQVWGVNFQRYINRLNESDYWTAVIRDRPLLQQMGEISGLSGIHPGHNIELFPYVGLRSSRQGDQTDQKVAGGLDFKYGIASNVILDMTASPDFSEVESDPFIYQLTPYENYFQENRPFFNEGSQYFNLATENSMSFQGPSYKLFYSRRIPSPKIAAKVTGKADGWSFGVLGAWNKGDAEEGADAGFSIVRVQKDIFTNSQIGIYYTGFDTVGDHNHNVAVDYQFNFHDIYYIRGASILTYNTGVASRNNGLHFLRIEREPDAGLRWSIDASRIEKNAKISTGFITRGDVQSASAYFGYAWRYDRSQLKHFDLSLGGNLEQSCDFSTTGRSLNFRAELDFQSQMWLEMELQTGRSRYQVAAADENLFWTKDFIGNYGGNLQVGWFRGGVVKEFRIWAGWRRQGVYSDDFRSVGPGYHSGAMGELVLRPLSNFQVGLSADWTHESLAATRAVVFSGTAYSASLHYQFNNSLFLSTNLKGETRESQYNLDLVLGCYFGAGNIVQLVYKKSRAKVEGWPLTGDAITLKCSYLLRL